MFFNYEPETGSLTPQQGVCVRGQPAAQLHRSVRSRHPGTLGMGWRSMDTGRLSSQFNLDPSGTFLYACNQRSDQITSFECKGDRITDIHQAIYAVDTPLCITFSSRDVLLSGSIPNDSVASNSQAKAYDRCSAYWTHCLSSGRFLSTFCIDVV